MRSLSAFVFALLLVGSARATPIDTRELENVAAFARLYGAVRWFHPSDAAQEIDWNRYAVYGVERVRSARSPRALRRKLQVLFEPLVTGLEIRRGALPAVLPGQASDEALVMWMHEGFGGESPYRSERLGRPAADKELGHSDKVQWVPAAPLRGKTVRLRGRIRAEPANASSGAALFVNVYKPDGSEGYNDAMKDRLARDPQWREYAIEGRVDDDAKYLMIGVRVQGSVRAAFDALSFEVRDADGRWTAIQLQAAGFEAAHGWAENSTTDTARWLRIESNAVVSGDRIFASDLPEAAVEGRYAMHAVSAATLDEPLFDLPTELRGARAATVSLARGLSARVPLTLTDVSARVTSRQRLDALKHTLAALPPATPTAANVRLADVVVAWNVFRHFYPYWSEADVDWDGQLLPLLQAAAPDADEAAAFERMERLVHGIRDGHGFVYADATKSTRYWMPLALRRIDGKLVVVGSRIDEVRVGDIVRTVDGAPVGRLLEEYDGRGSGSAAWREWMSIRRIGSSLTQDRVRLGLERDGDVAEATVARGHKERPDETRPEPLSELAPGVWYVDLVRLTMDQVKPRLDTLAQARAVVFDMRGYPTDAGAGILPHLLDTAETTRWMHVPRYVAPFGSTAGAEPLGWDVTPKSPHIGGRIVFLTDARAISYAESVMGYVQDHALGAIVGAATAGANGDVATFDVPSGLQVRFTALRVTRHDGKTPFHLIGVQPTVPVEPTLAGIKAGRDEVLERALVEIGVEPVRR